MTTRKEPLWIELYDLMESKVDETKYINPILRNNPYYRSGVNDGLRVALGKIAKPKIAYLSKSKPRN
jgi:hypothetical protein